MPAVQTPTTEPDPATNQEESDTAKETWLDAYRKLREEGGTKKTVEAYKALLSLQLNSV
jgi:hypothetical protein